VSAVELPPDCIATLLVVVAVALTAGATRQPRAGADAAGTGTAGLPPSAWIGSGMTFWAGADAAALTGATTWATAGAASSMLASHAAATAADDRTSGGVVIAISLA
jgi:hypothetical protein